MLLLDLKNQSLIWPFPNKNDFFYNNLEAKGAKPIPKEKSVVRGLVVRKNMIYVISGDLEAHLQNHLL